MPVSKRFLSLLSFQLAQFADRDEVTSLVVYVTEPGPADTPNLIPVGQWPAGAKALPALSDASPLRAAEERRRWLPLRHRGMLLGALQVETSQVPWPEPLNQRLRAVALCLTEGLCLDLEHRQLQHQLNLQQEQLRVLLHQLRNPLAALRTFGQLLLRRLGGDSRNRPLVEGLLREEQLLRRYVDAIDRLGQGEAVFAAAEAAPPLLLPPSLGGGPKQPLGPQLQPLLQRAAATASLQSRRWHPPGHLPDWQGDTGSVAEILANLLENAFRYSPPGAPVGLHVAGSPQQNWQLTVWDGGTPIPEPDRERIFQPGVRGADSADLPGTGLGLALARELARRLGGDLSLEDSPRRIDASLPERGNAFRLTLPPQDTTAGP
ncbi:sensor histidine kinase KdpD [Cyanobium sp. CH-040]|uniref:sensor histidine kinase n=1 Tax=Cyanobium sp. CH-040 TaxID=2823708 RepID=UPI0020CF3487|nr:HAMP domain-containing sensor histidine kinase [Cyanobium sp. CH-040]MCP9927387.1 sensor histidine kinase [Cyanobium sp. CH-040]